MKVRPKIKKSSANAYLAGRALPLERPAEIVDDDVGAAGSKEQRVRLAQPAAGAGHDDGLAVKTEV